MTDYAAHISRARRGPRRLMPRLTSIVLVAACCITAAGAAQGNDSSEPYSKANQMLFMDNQLDNVKPPLELDYTYSVSGTADNYSDHINLAVRSGKADGRTVKVDFLSGKRHRYVPEVTHAEGNPITKIFLQHDVWMLGQQTGGSWRYFQKQIKTALQNNAEIKHGKAQYHGHSVDVTRISISPYANMSDHRNDMGKAVGKQYMFVLSNDVPGGVLQITSTIQGNGKIKDNVRSVVLDGSKPMRPARKPEKQNANT